MFIVLKSESDSEIIRNVMLTNSMHGKQKEIPITAGKR